MHLLIHWPSSSTMPGIPRTSFAKSLSGIRRSGDGCWSRSRNAIGSTARGKQLDGSEKTMKKPRALKPAAKPADELGVEYRFDASKAKPNRFASQVDQTRLVEPLSAGRSESPRPMSACPSTGDEACWCPRCSCSFSERFMCLFRMRVSHERGDVPTAWRCLTCLSPFFSRR